MQIARSGEHAFSDRLCVNLTPEHHSRAELAPWPPRSRRNMYIEGLRDECPVLYARDNTYESEGRERRRPAVMAISEGLCPDRLA